MDLDNVLVVDIETKGLLEDIEGVESDLHILGVCYKSNGDNWSTLTTNKKEDIKKLFENPDNTIVGHNFLLFDLPSIEKIYKDINVQATIIDSLLISWYIEPNRMTHGLEVYGEEFGVKKTKVDSSEWVGIGQDKLDIIKYFEDEVK